MRYLSEKEEELCCGCASLDDSTPYDLPLHVAAIFILFAVAILGTLVPIVSTRGPFASQQTAVLEWLMSFGFGVVIGTGFIHMISEGIEMLSNKCLGPVVEEYGSLGLAVVLGTVLLMHLIECESAVFFAGQGGGGGGHGHGHGHAPAAAQPRSSMGQSFFAITPYDTEVHQAYQPKPSIPMVSASLSSAPKSAKRKVSVALFEMGVLFHSLVVGVNLGVSSGAGFTTLLIAMCIHQFFEGVALGGSTLGAMETLKQAMMMNLGFAMTTPAGIVFGILVRSSYSETSVASLWVQGILNCVAGGILLYTGLVELLTYQMTTNNDFLNRSGRERAMLYFALWSGAGLMALIGKWA